MTRKGLVAVGEVEPVRRSIVSKKRHRVFKRLKEAGSVCGWICFPVATDLVFLGELMIVLEIGAMKFVWLQRVFVLIHADPKLTRCIHGEAVWVAEPS